MGKKSKVKKNLGSEKPSSKSATLNTSPVNGSILWLLTLTAVLPLLYTRSLNDTNLALRYTVLSGFFLLFTGWFYLARKNRLQLNGRLIKWVFVFAGLFFAWSLVSVSYAANRVETFYPLARFLLVMAALFLLAVQASVNPNFLLQLSKIIVLFSFLHSLSGLGQYFGWGFTEIPGNYTPYGFMANRNLYGSALALMFPFSLYLFYKGSSVWKTLAAFSLVLLLCALVFSQTRSSWLAVAGCIVTVLVLGMILLHRLRKKWLIHTALVLVVSSAFTFFMIRSDTSGNLAASVSERIGINTPGTAETNTRADYTISDRLLIWKSTLQMIGDYPLGVGPGNWKINAPFYGKAGMAWAGGFYVPDYPHNVYLHITAEYGFPGTVLYFSIWILIAICGFVSLNKKLPEEKRVAVILMLGGLAAFAIDSFFSFPTERMEHNLYMLLMAGTLLGIYSTEQTPAGQATQRGNKFLPVFLFLVFLINLALGMERMRFEKLIAQANAYLKKEDYPSVLSRVSDARSDWVSLDPNGRPRTFYSGLAYKELKQYPQAMDHFRQALKLAPYSAAIYNNIGTLYTETGEYSNAIIAYENALKLAPEFDIIFKNLAVNYFNIGRYDKCIEALSKVNTAGDDYLLSLLSESKRRLGRN